MAFAVKYRCTHKELSGNTTVQFDIEILEDGFAGSVTELKGMGDIFRLSYEKTDTRNVFENPVQKGRLEFYMAVRNSSELTILQEFLGNDEAEFQMRLKKDSTVIWTGYILNDLIEYSEDDYPFQSTVVAKDLTRLSGIDFDDGAGGFVSDRVTIIQTIAEFLDDTGLSLPIYTYTSWTEENVTAAQGNEDYDFLNQIYNERENFREFAQTGDEEDEFITIAEGLSWVLRNYGLVLRQVDGAWRIYQVTALSDPTSVYEFEYNASGVQQSVSTAVDITQDIDRVARYILTGNNEQYPGIKKARVTFDHRTQVRSKVFPRSIQINDVGSESFSQFFLSDGAQEIEFRFLASVRNSTDEPQMLARFQIQADAYYLQNDGTWDTVANIFEFELTPGREPDGTTFTWRGDFSITTETVPAAADGTLTVTFYNAEDDGNNAPDTTSYGSIVLNIVNGVAQENSLVIDYQLTQSGGYSTNLKLEDTFFGDGPVGYSPSALRFSSADSDTTVDSWQRRGTTTNYRNLHENLLKEVIDTQRTEGRTLRPVIWGDFSPYNVITYDSTNFFFIGGELNGRNRWRGEFIEINIQTGTDTFQDLPKFTDDGGQTAASAGGGSVSQDSYDNRYFRQSQLLGEIDTADQNTALGNLGLTATKTEINRLDGGISDDGGIVFYDLTSDQLQTSANATVDANGDALFNNLEVTGTINYVSENNLQVEDKTITVNKGGTAGSAENAGLIIENPNGDESALWNSTDGFLFSDAIKATGDITIERSGSYAALRLSRTTTSTADFSLRAGFGQLEVYDHPNATIHSVFKEGGGLVINGSSLNGYTGLYVSGTVGLGGSLTVSSGGIVSGTHAAASGSGVSTNAFIDVLATDTETILSSRNDSASGDPDQFYIRHNLGRVEMGNLRGTTTFETAMDFGATIKADNFSAGSTGWQIAYDGDAEVKSLISRSNIQIHGAATGDTNIAALDFYDSDGTTRRGFIGDAASGDDDIYIGADTGIVRINTNGTVAKFNRDGSVNFADEFIFNNGGSEIGTDIPAIEITGGITSRSGGLRLKTSDLSGVFQEYIATDFIWGTTTATDIQVRTDNTEIATWLSGGGLDIKTGNVGADNFSAGTTGWQIAYDGDAEFDDLNVRGGLFAKEFIVEQTRVMTDFRMSVGGGRVESVSGSAGSETVTLSDDFSNANPFANGDIVLIQQRTGAFSGTIIKKIYRRVDSISSLDVVLSTTGITWTAGTANDDTGSIAPGDDISIVGHVSDATRDHFIHYDIAGLAVPAIRFFDGITDVDPTATDEIMRVGGLDPGGSNKFSSSLTGDIGIAGKVSGNLAFAVTDSEGLIGGFNFDDTHLWTENAGAANSFSGIQKRAADSTRVGFWGADDEDGTNANAYFTADGKLFYDGLAQVIFAQNDQASATQNDDIGSGPPTGITWVNFAEATAGSAPVTERDTKFKVIWYKRFGIDTLRLLFYRVNVIINSDLNVTNTARVYLYVQNYRTSTTVATTNMEWTSNQSAQAESIDLDVSGLSDDTRYEVLVDMYANVDASGQGGGSTYDTQIEVADDVVILGLTS